MSNDIDPALPKPIHQACAMLDQKKLSNIVPIFPHTVDLDASSTAILGHHALAATKRGLLIHRAFPETLPRWTSKIPSIGFSRNRCSWQSFHSHCCSQSTISWLCYNFIWPHHHCCSWSLESVFLHPFLPLPLGLLTLRLCWHLSQWFFFCNWNFRFNWGGWHCNFRLHFRICAAAAWTLSLPRPRPLGCLAPPRPRPRPRAGPSDPSGFGGKTGLNVATTFLGVPGAKLRSSSGGAALFLAACKANSSAEGVLKKTNGGGSWTRWHWLSSHKAFRYSEAFSNFQGGSETTRAVFRNSASCRSERLFLSSVFFGNGSKLAAREVGRTKVGFCVKELECMKCLQRRKTSLGSPSGTSPTSRNSWESQNAV